MRYVYIAGLEHSGTTLLTYLLGKRSGVVGLGEVGQFFSPQHMRNYMATWNGYEDVRLCSCGKDWEDCEFWGGVYHLSGLNSEVPLEKKYAELMAYCEARHESECVYVDSSKNLEYLEPASVLWGGKGNPDAGISVLWSVKDVRSFTLSIDRKSRNRSFVRTARTFNWWLGGNRKILKRLEQRRTSYTVALYERLCLEPEASLSEISTGIGIDGTTQGSGKDMTSHIILANKDFLSRNRENLKYDARWFLDLRINLAYVLHGKARRMNEWLYRISGQSDRGG